MRLRVIFVGVVELWERQRCESDEGAGQQQQQQKK